MKEKMYILTRIGILIYILYSLVDRFIVRISNIVAIPLMIFGILMIVVGYIKRSRDI